MRRLGSRTRDGTGPTLRWATIPIRLSGAVSRSGQPPPPRSPKIGHRTAHATVQPLILLRPSILSYPDYVCGYDPYYRYVYRFAYLPLYLSAEALYGPRAVQRFMGVADGFQPRPDANIIAPPAGGNVEADAPEPKKAVERATNTQANALAWRFIGFGDAQFAAQKFADANQRYRKASQSAPQLADAWFRQGFALSAIGRDDLAVGAINRGLKINPNWAKSGFDLKELYGPDELAKDARLDVLAQAAATSRSNLLHSWASTCISGRAGRTVLPACQACRRRCGTHSDVYGK